MSTSRRIHQIVGEFQEPNTSIAKQHEQDLTYTTIALINHIVDGLRASGFKRISFPDKVLEASKIMKEVPLMREKIGMLETTVKNDLYNYYHGNTSYAYNYRIPNKINTFKQFTQRKSTRVREAALTIALEVYWLDMNNRKEEE